MVTSRGNWKAEVFRCPDPSLRTEVILAKAFKRPCDVVVDCGPGRKLVVVPRIQSMTGVGKKWLVV